MDHLSLFPLPAASLSHEETRRLLRAAQAGDRQARDTLVQANLRLARSMVQRFTGRGADLEDLFQVACVGLVKAIDRFDLQFDVRFSTYAVPSILGEIRRYLQKDKPIKVGRALQEKAAAVLRAREELTQELERSPTPAEIAMRLGMEREDVVTALEAVAPLTSLEDTVHQDDDDSLQVGDQLGVESPVGALVENMALRQVFTMLSDTEQSLVTMRFFREMRQADVARAMGVSQAHISRMERRVLAKMRDMLA